MLKEIRISNFKAFGKLQKIPLGKITLIYGPNSAGKSSIIQSILLMKQSTILESTPTSENKVVFRGEDVDLGNFESAIYKHDVTKKIRIGFSFDSPNSRSASTRHNISRSALKSVDVSINTIPDSEEDKNGDAWIEEIDFGIFDKTTSLVRVAQTENPAKDLDDNVNTLYKIKNLDSAINLSRMISSIDKNTNNSKKNSMGSKFDLLGNQINKIWKELNFIPTASMPGQILLNKKLIENHKEILELGLFEHLFIGSLPIDSIRRGLLAEFANVSYLGPLRSPPARHYIVSGSDKGSVGQRGERMPQLLYRRKNKLIPRLNDQLEQFQIPYKVNVSNAGDSLTGDIIAMSLTDAHNVVVSPSDVGFGIGQLMPILVEGTVSSGKTICVEQPEIHIHPRLQGHLADFFFNTSKVHGEEKKSGKAEPFGGNQWIVESHSEALILRLQTLIKKQNIPPDFVTVLYVQPTDEGSQVLHLRLDTDGEFLDEWPNGFFEESFQEIFINRR
ncbi:hypothetical protein AD948_06470 [Acetobacter senegalensis]|uniref:Endonuclease GajA/Old nuclease/RecF-like AAA domain-containing protein n=1 Tax=Acetobacter senegalensis TaxID=446692 RepID=A0A149U3W5_9PROT|nr:AAA family ATPase [Acetobacter senegalensis]KXV60047.1 hypothetical protein AD948_06470 [Acetobacter senegalensis]